MIVLPTREKLFNPILAAMHALKKPSQKKAIFEELCRQQEYPPEIIALKRKKRSGLVYHPIRYNMDWGLTLLKKYGLVDNPQQGVWQLTEKGQITHHVDPKAVADYYKRKATPKKTATTNNQSASTPFVLKQLQIILQQRYIRRPAGSYATELFSAGPALIAQKVGEEALEVIIAALHENRERQVSEIADLFFHTLVLLVELNIPLEEVLAELQRRHEKRN